MGRNTVIGIMSGTSVDGLDMVAVEFTKPGDQWKYDMVKSQSYDYPETLRKKLIDCIGFSGRDLIMLDHELGLFIADRVNDFCRNEKFSASLISSHGHTVFHQPEKGVTTQIGDGEVISLHTGITTLSDFRKKDVLKGGQGAPLVPVGDKLLFHDYEFCLNIGGFSNISFDNRGGQRIAFDICAANIVLNHLARKAGVPFDDKGMIARKGKLIPGLLKKLDQLDYYDMSRPKSLGLEWVQENIFPLLDEFSGSIPDLLRTCTVHTAGQINRAIEKEVKARQSEKKPAVLVTGGGAYNDLLIELLQQAPGQYHIRLPDKTLIDYKEALVFAFMGFLRSKGMVNIWSSVTGARDDSSAGVIHEP